MTHTPLNEERLIEQVSTYFYKIPFNKVLGLKIHTVTLDRFVIEMPMREDLVGNYVYQILHGGVISSILDVAGGCMVALGMLERIRELPDEKRSALMGKIGTIDLRVDYLRPGRGQLFLASAQLLRTGNKVSVARMELHNEKGELLSTGTGTYLCG